MFVLPLTERLQNFSLHHFWDVSFSSLMCKDIKMCSMLVNNFMTVF